MRWPSRRNSVRILRRSASFGGPIRMAHRPSMNKQKRRLVLAPKGLLTRNQNLVATVSWWGARGSAKPTCGHRFPGAGFFLTRLCCTQADHGMLVRGMM